MGAIMGTWQPRVGDRVVYSIEHDRLNGAEGVVTGVYPGNLHVYWKPDDIGRRARNGMDWFTGIHELTYLPAPLYQVTWST